VSENRLDDEAKAASASAVISENERQTGGMKSMGILVLLTIVQRPFL